LRPKLPAAETPPSERLDVVQQSFAATPTAPRWARRHTAEILERWGVADLEATVVQIVSELVANAAARQDPLSGPPGVVRLTLRLLPNRVVVEVFDSDPAVPVLIRAGDDDERGRGLAIVKALSCALTVTPLPSGKVVTAQVRRPRTIGWGR
jgi:anti-sigma regulatory factor (Ser/Thr protein kinase)